MLAGSNRLVLSKDGVCHSKYFIFILLSQEVDHFKFLQCILGTQNYEGVFFPKPDSPCLYINENNGPDGCAIFYKSDKLDMIDHETRILEVWRIQSNQVAIAANMRVRETGQEFTVCTTHLKARHGALLAKLRNEQGKVGINIHESHYIRQLFKYFCIWIL